MHISKVCLLHDSFPTSEQYPFNLEIFNKTDCIGFSRPVTFFIGENGTGKSTLLKAIARHCSIHIWEETGRIRRHYNRYEDDLFRYLKVEQDGDRIQGSFFASEIFRHFAEILDEWSVADPGSLDYFGSTSLVEKSHGQAHMTFFAHRFQRRGMYLLDEPENALSPKRQLELLKLFRHFTADGAVQFIIATHSPILLAYPDADIYSFDTVPIQRIEYEETDYYRIFRDFLDHREKYLNSL
ncbi:MAG: AAA family ATPase [Methanoregulaceae archaeon]|jgi:predicted ATPase|nr:AAA family ATPase [Methanoregulaceae archaeon]MCU0628243.1 AAA family ATPase [Methanoregulaceae archaeon]